MTPDRIIRFAGALLIGLGIAWMVMTANLASFLAVFGDCGGEGCGGYFGTLEENARVHNLLGPVGLLFGAVAVLAIFSRYAAAGLIAIAAAMIVLLPLSLGAPIGEWWIPGVDVRIGAFTLVLLVQLPAAALYLAGAVLVMVAHRMARRSERQLSTAPREP